MTTEEKLRAMEALWADLTRNADDFESPVWHADVLREREQHIAEGKETFVDGKRPSVSSESAICEGPYSALSSGRLVRG